jgi:pimeloyl-ACP methyl ester carboxylesterase
MTIQAMTLFFCVALVGSVQAQDSPPPDAFQVMPHPTVPGPSITPYLRYQTELAWRQDDQRREKWRGIRTEQDLLRIQQELRVELLHMLGGLPKDKTPLHAQITGRIQMAGFHIEKLVFQSLPGIYVTALVYVPEDNKKLHPAVLVASGHSENGKIHYQALCQHLVQQGYVVLNWDPIGQGERSQFWDAEKKKSRYNLICAEHAVMGNLAYLAGTNLARWEIWDGIRAVDYVLTRNDVDSERINIAGTSGGGFQAAHIAALDPRIKMAVPSCYITALPMRVFNRIFQDPDSDPEQDLYGMISRGIDNAGLLLMMYPRPVFVAAAVLDFFPIQGTQRTFREVAAFYGRFGHADRIAMHEGYHGHEFSTENQLAAVQFLNHFNGVPESREFAKLQEVDDKALQCTRSGQVMLDFQDAKSGMDLIRDYYQEQRTRTSLQLKRLYYSESHPDIQSWSVLKDENIAPRAAEIRWELMGSWHSSDVVVDRYLIHHSGYLELPMLYFHQARKAQRLLLWLREDGKLQESDWEQVRKRLDEGYDVVSIDPRGLGETRMLYKAASPDDPSLAQVDEDRAYISPISGVLADYVYNSLLTGRPYFLQMIEDVEIAFQFARKKLGAEQLCVAGSGHAATLANAVSEVLPNVKSIPTRDGEFLKWSDLVSGKVEDWPIQYTLPAGAYVH